MILMPNLQSFLIVFESALEILQFAVNPADAVRHAWMPEKIAVPSRHPNRFIQRLERLRHSAEVAFRQSQEKHRGQQQETVTQFSREPPPFSFNLNRAFIFSLKEIEATAPD